MNPVYVVPAMVKPGKQYYLVKGHDTVTSQFTSSESQSIASHEAREPSYFLHKAIVPTRDPLLPRVSKNYKAQEVERVFVKKNSVFKPWLPDTPASLQKISEADESSQNLTKIVKEESEMQ